MKEILDQRGNPNFFYKHKIVLTVRTPFEKSPESLLCHFNDPWIEDKEILEINTDLRTERKNND